MSRTLKNTFLAHSLVCLVFGLVHFLSPALWARIAGYTAFDPYVTRVLGAALLSLALASWLGYCAHTWDEVHIMVRFELVFTVLGAVAMLYSFLVEAAPLFIWVPLAVFVIFAGLWAYCLMQPHVAGTPTVRGSGPAPSTR